MLNVNHCVHRSIDSFESLCAHACGCIAVQNLPDAVTVQEGNTVKLMMLS